MVRPRFTAARSGSLRRSSRAVPRRTGLTLIEILIVLVLLVAAAAVAIPAMTRRFESTRFDATGDQVIATLALARAESQRQRRAVQILWNPADRALYATWLETSALQGDDADALDEDRIESTAPPQEPGDKLTPARPGASESDRSRALGLGGSRLRLILPEGFRVQTGAAAVDESHTDELTGRASEAVGERLGSDPEEAQPVSLLVYMPDGSTFGDASFTIVDAAGRQLRISVNPWTGQATASELERAPNEADDIVIPGEESPAEGEP